MKKIITTLLACWISANVVAQNPIDIDLWPNGLPNSNGIDTTQPYDDSKQNFKPSIRVFLPEKSKANGMAVVILPGGAYSHLASGHEGYDWAKFYNDLGIAAIVLKYRMPHGNFNVPISDATEAMRLTREHATEWNINKQRIGIQGSSAGGHLASTIATHSDPATRPDFQVLFYPVISMQPGVTHQGSHDNLLGKQPSFELTNQYSNANQVNSSTPPAILLLSDDDDIVPAQNSAEYYLALKKAGVKNSAIQVYPSGGHGWGYMPSFKYHNEMLTDLTIWIKSIF